MDAPAIDGTLNGVPIQLKDLTERGYLQKLLTHASKAETKASKYGYNGLELYMNAPGFNKAQIIDFVNNGPISKIPSQGTIDYIYIKASDGWLIIK